MKFVALVSGGKDSIYSILLAVRQGHELVACIHLARPDDEMEEEESYMYQTAASEAVRTQVEECLGVPLISHVRKGKSVNTTLVYDDNNQHEDDDKVGDEVEDLYQALAAAKEQFPEVTAVSSGAILSTYQRVRIENVCSRLGLQSLSYLWRMHNQKQLFELILKDGLSAVLVKTAAPPGLVPSKHLNKTLLQLRSHFLTLHDKYQFHVCGEGGEYESLVLDCPGLFQQKLVLDSVEIVEEEDGVSGVLFVKACHAEPKDKVELQQLPATAIISSAPKLLATSPSAKPTQTAAATLQSTQQIISNQTVNFQPAPHVRRVRGGLWSVSEIMSSIPARSKGDGGGAATSSEADLAVTEAQQVFSILKRVLDCLQCTCQDVVMVHLYLSEISHFANINQHYRTLFGVLLPPSRSTVAVGRHVLPGGRRVLLDCLVQCGSGEYMRTTATPSSATNPYAKAAHAASGQFKLRDVLHVQSISHWAPVCVGPYSQANTFRGCLHFCAGQIGLMPSTMMLRDTWMEQLEQSWTNIARVLDALGGASIREVMSCLIFISDSVFHEAGAIQTMEAICKAQMDSNADVTPGSVDGTVMKSEQDCLDGYEDEETRREVEGTAGSNNKGKLPFFPILVVSIPQMPVGALTEIEVIAASRRAASCLGISQESPMVSCYHADAGAQVDIAPLGWDTGHDFLQVNADADNMVRVDSSFRHLGPQSASCALVTAKLLVVDQSDKSSVDTKLVLIAMLKTLQDEPSFDSNSIINLRLYYIAASVETDGSALTVVPQDDGTLLRFAFHLAIGSMYPGSTMPAATVIPVSGMHVFSHPDLSCVDINGAPFLALQAVSTDPLRMESEVWIRNR